MESSARTTLIEKENIKENCVAAQSEIAPEAAFTGDEWIRQPTQPLLTHKDSRKTESLTTQK